MSEDSVSIQSLNGISDRLGENVSHVEDLRRLSGGASQETWSFYAVSPAGRRKLILRRSPFASSGDKGADLKTEALILRGLDGSGIPAPAVVYVCEPQDQIGSAYIMEAIEGEALPQKIMRDPKYAKGLPNIASQCGVALAKLHSVSTANLPVLETLGALDQVEKYETLLRQYGLERPVLELAIKWLKDNAPQTESTSLIHGDFRMGNLMIDENGLSGILDWELCHLGDPLEDIGWLCVNSWRFGQRQKRVGGVGELSELLDAYNAQSGTSYTSKDVDYWEILGTLKWGIMCATMYDTFRTGMDPSIERGSIGRRTSETEIDLMNILETV